MPGARQPAERATQDGDILVRRSVARILRREHAERAAAEIIAEGRNHSLAGLSVRELRDEGRLSLRPKLL